MVSVIFVVNKNEYNWLFVHTRTNSVTGKYEIIEPHTFTKIN